MAFNHFPMPATRPAIAADPLGFGRGRTWRLSDAPAERGAQLSDDLRLFASTFAAGFMFVAILIA
jgi:hypothetical protein